jgi:hypothetical protein
MRSLSFAFLIASLLTSISPPAFAEESEFDGIRGMGVNLGTTWLWDRASGAEGRYPPRFLRSLTLNANPGYYFGSFFAGLDFSYRFTAQSASEAPSSPSLRGNGWLGGFHLDYREGPWILGGAIRFLGQNSSADSDITFHRPRGLQAFLSYQPFQQTPFTVDGVLEYTRYRRASFGEISGSPLIYWGAGVGVTYRFGPKPVIKESTEIHEELQNPATRPVTQLPDGKGGVKRLGKPKEATP